MLAARLSRIPGPCEREHLPVYIGLDPKVLEVLNPKP